MKVKVTVTLDIDKEAWANEFGVVPDEVRRDVQTYMAGTCEEQLKVLGLGTVDWPDWTAARTVPAKGMHVRIIGDGPMGTLSTLSNFRFEDEVALRGDVGVYESRHPNRDLEDWHIVVFDSAAGERYCPLPSSAFEVVKASEPVSTIRAFG